MIYYNLFFFFFSSRRRHTRFDCDWSSDVCSSDLPRSRTAGTAAAGRARRGALARRRRGRSEERRVGKECRSRWSPSHLKKKRKEEANLRNSLNSIERRQTYYIQSTNK